MCLQPNIDALSYWGYLSVFRVKINTPLSWKYNHRLAFSDLSPSTIVESCVSQRTGKLQKPVSQTLLFNSLFVFFKSPSSKVQINSHQVKTWSTGESWFSRVGGWRTRDSLHRRKKSLKSMLKFHITTCFLLTLNYFLCTLEVIVCA